MTGPRTTLSWPKELGLDLLTRVPSGAEGQGLIPHPSRTNFGLRLVYRVGLGSRFGFPREFPRNSRGKGNFYQSDVISATGI